VYRKLRSMGLLITIDTGVAVADLIQRRHACWTASQCKNFVFSTPSRPTLRHIQPPIKRLLRNSTPEFKRKGRLFYHPPPSKAEIKTRGAINPEMYVFMAYFLTNIARRYILLLLLSFQMRSFTIVFKMLQERVRNELFSK
jgi:hypothetical protein